MFFLSSTTHAKRSSQNTEDKFIRNALISIWGLLVIFGFLTLIQPKWLKEISSPGKKSEAMDLKYYGDQYLKKGNYKSAVSIYKKAIETQPDLYIAIGNLGIAYRELNDYDKAIQMFKYLLKKDSEHLHTNYYNLAELYRRKGDIQTAISYYTKSAETNPFPIYSYQFLGELYSKLQEWDLMIDSFEKALKNRLTLENSYYGMLKKVGGSTFDEPKIQAAIQHWQENSIEPDKYDDKIFTIMLKKDKEIAKIHNYLGLAYNQLNDETQAVSHYEQALRIWPGFIEAKQNLKKVRK